MYIIIVVVKECHSRQVDLDQVSEAGRCVM